MAMWVSATKARRRWVRFLSVPTTSCGLYVDYGLPRTFEKVLVANRGEIACRVMRTARQLGVKTVAVYSRADRKALHVEMANEAYLIGEAPASESYLRHDAIIEVAKKSGANAIHPGYGFLSENVEFAKKCFEAGIEFIGPPVGAIDSMGSKSASKAIMIDAGVPVVPGYHGEEQSVEHLKAEASKIDYPVMLKAVLGGGGKGMRIVEDESQFESLLDSCKRESKASFGDDRVLLERYIRRPRHIEFQIFADKHGNVVHLFERDCSVQRRHQKVLEEAPAPGFTEEMRSQMGTAAVNAAKAVGYVGAGTVEFILDAETGEFFFMEMNTRLQVEHPVTEMIMKKDLVQLQLHVAAGHQLPFGQEELKATGHSLEARVYAENPQNNFLPSTGVVEHLVAPQPRLRGDVRVETGVRQGDAISVYYDPMISKLVVWGADREAALKRMEQALLEYEVGGLTTNLSFLKRAVSHPAFAKGGVETGFIPDHFDELLPPLQKPSAKNVVFAVLHLLHNENIQSTLTLLDSKDFTSPWQLQNSFRVNAPNLRKLQMVWNEKEDEPEIYDVTVEYDSELASYNITVNDETFPAVSSKIDEFTGQLIVDFGSNIEHVSVADVADGIQVFNGQDRPSFERVFLDFTSTGGAVGHGSTAPMPGKIIRLLVEPGTEVEAGDPLVIMEAMKMEHVIKAPGKGVISRLPYKEGDIVEGGAILVEFSENDEESE